MLFRNMFNIVHAFIVAPHWWYPSNHPNQPNHPTRRMNRNIEIEWKSTEQWFSHAPPVHKHTHTSPPPHHLRIITGHNMQLFTVFRKHIEHVKIFFENISYLTYDGDKWVRKFQHEIVTFLTFGICECARVVGLDGILERLAFISLPSEYLTGVEMSSRNDRQVHCLALLLVYTVVFWKLLSILCHSQ